MSTWALGIAYNGKDYHGWQRQPDRTTVQGELEKALSRIADQPVTLIVAGRTDKGVHATGQVAHFKADVSRSDHDWLRGLNGLTPPSMQITWVKQVAEGFHARYSAVSRSYTYLYREVSQDVFLDDFVWCIDPVDVDLMHQEAQTLLGEHDFSTFRGSGCQSVTPMRRVNRATVRREGAFVVLEIEANAFLLHMVRNIAAALYARGCGAEKRSMQQLLALRDRTQAGLTAPPQGLYLSRVSYPDYQLPAPAPLSWLSPNSTFIPPAVPLD
ncbi:MAG: tRNA pseudouridine(38-40) synthase TruA [Pseudomonadales bacterium]